jgi:uncharacterized membrane protein YfcA
MPLRKELLVGFIAGVIATAPMTVEFWLARRGKLIDEVPPHKAIRSVAPHLREPALSSVSAVAHMLVGGVAGAVYGAALPRRLRGALSGALFGIGVWVTGYELVMPAATNIKPAHRDRRERAGTIFVAHLIYGAVLGLLTRRAEIRR